IPLSPEMVSVGLVVTAASIRRRSDKDLRAYYAEALRKCREIEPLLRGASRTSGVDPQRPERDFFTAADWSYESGEACGDGWIAAGDAAFFTDPLLSSGVMMAHLSGHRAACTINTAG